MALSNLWTIEDSTLLNPEEYKCSDPYVSDESNGV